MCRVSDIDSSDKSEISRVSFSTIEFHEHAMILGCSPSTTCGPPLEIDWEKMSTAIYSLDDYEELRPPRRIKQQLIMPKFLREDVLIENGYTRNQIHHHLQQLKGERRASLRVSIKLPIRILGKAGRSLLGSMSSNSKA